MSESLDGFKVGARVRLTGSARKQFAGRPHLLTPDTGTVIALYHGANLISVQRDGQSIVKDFHPDFWEAA